MEVRDSGARGILIAKLNFTSNMPLSSGDKLGSYEILTTIGTGGRSEVSEGLSVFKQFLIFIAFYTCLHAQIQTGPPLAYRVVEGWPQLPTG
jgi:hypothetical protein